MVRELKAEYGDDKFQQRLREIAAKHRKPSHEWGKARQLLLQEVQGRVLPKYGFEGRATGVLHMMQFFGQHPEFNQNAEFAASGQEIQALIDQA